MSHFSRWWSRQYNKDEAAKNFASIVWQEASKPYQKSIENLENIIKAQAEEKRRYKKALERIAESKEYGCADQKERMKDYCDVAVDIAKEALDGKE